MMIFAIVFALACAGSLEAYTKCNDYPFETRSAFEILKDFPTMFYVGTNHYLEECAVAIYTAGSDGMSGEWDVYNKTSSIMHCALTREDGKENGVKFLAKVAESGATYNLSIAAYNEGKSFCWVQCEKTDDKVVEGGDDFADFLHCFAATEEAADPKIFYDFIENSGLKFNEHSSFRTVYTEGCNSFENAKMIAEKESQENALL